MLTTFTAQTAGWTDDQRDRLLSRFIAFPLWDAMIFPTIALRDVPQFTPITFSRFSPVDANYLDGVGHQKLQGTAIHHFGGFFQSEYRENDYLWGRLDGAELCLRTLRSAVGGYPMNDEDAVSPHLPQALKAVIQAEAEHLPQVSELRRAVADRLASPRPAAPR